MEKLQGARGASGGPAFIETDNTPLLIGVVTNAVMLWEYLPVPWEAVYC